MQIVHFKHNLTQRSVCGQFEKMKELVVSQDIDEVNCVGCLRALLKSAGQYGNGPKVDRSAGRRKFQ